VLGCDFFERLYMYACTHFNLCRISRPCLSSCEVLFFGAKVFVSDGSLFCLLVRIKCVFFAHVLVCTLENDHRSTCLHVYMLHGCIFSAERGGNFLLSPDTTKLLKNNYFPYLLYSMSFSLFLSNSF
jgi:hypothetical protein